MKKATVSIIIGSDSDLEIIQHTCDTLKSFNIKFDLKILSAHRTPELLRNYIKKIEKNGIKIIISAAGFAAHLPGVIASYTYLPVIGVPLDSSSLKGLDSLLSIVQMPSGIPVLTTTIGRVGAINAALATVEILATSDKSLKTKLNKFRNEQTKKIKDKDELLERIGYNKYIAKKNK